MKNLSLVLPFSMCLFLSSLKAPAANFRATITDTPGINYKMGRQGFLDEYGKDDSSRALINYFFKKRKSGTKGAAGGAGSSVLAAVVFSATYNSSERLALIFIGVPLLIIAFGMGLFAIYSMVKLIMFSRKRLAVLLEDYHAGKGIPENIIEKRRYRKWLGRESE